MNVVQSLVPHLLRVNFGDFFSSRLPIRKFVCGEKSRAPFWQACYGRCLALNKLNTTDEGLRFCLMMQNQCEPNAEEFVLMLR